MVNKICFRPITFYIHVKNSEEQRNALILLSHLGCLPHEGRTSIESFVAYLKSDEYPYLTVHRLNTVNASMRINYNKPCFSYKSFWNEYGQQSLW